VQSARRTDQETIRRLTFHIFNAGYAADESDPSAPISGISFRFMPNQIVPSVSSFRSDNNHQEDIHTVAEKFLRDHLAKTGSRCEVVRSVVPRSACTVEPRKAAEGFLREHLATRKTDAKRFEIEAPEKVILARRGVRSTTFFYGWRRGTAIFTHAQHLAQLIDVARSEELVQVLRQCNVEVTVLPAPEMGRESF
jgi:hypothetical protein